MISCHYLYFLFLFKRTHSSFFGEFFCCFSKEEKLYNVSKNKRENEGTIMKKYSFQQWTDSTPTEISYEYSQTRSDNLISILFIIPFANKKNGKVMDTLDLKYEFNDDVDEEKNLQGIKDFLREKLFDVLLDNNTYQLPFVLKESFTKNRGIMVELSSKHIKKFRIKRYILNIEFAPKDTDNKFTTRIIFQADEKEKYSLNDNIEDIYRLIIRDIWSRDSSIKKI
jgi:hypothetical protein